MGATAEQLILTAEGDVNKTRDQVNCSGTHDWCAQYMSRILERNEYDIEETFVTPLHNKLLSTGLWEDIDTPQRGAFIFLDWNHIVEERPLEHVGIISSVNGNTIRYVNGNALPDRSIVSYSERQVDDPDIIYITQLKGSGGEFFTDKCVYDVSYAQSAETVQALCNDTTTGGLILRFAWNDELDRKVTEHYAKCKTANMPVGFYSASNKNITADGESAYRTMLEAQRDLLSNTLNVTPTDCLIGVWLDLETWGYSAGSSGCGISATPDENVRQIELFREVFGTLNFPVLGFYCNYSELTSYLIGASTNEWKTYPFWYSSPGSSRATVDSEMNSFGITNAYIWQDGFPKDGDEWNYWWSPDKTYVHKQINGNWLDNDTILKPIPTSGGGGGGTVSAVTVSVVAPKRIYFSPNPDVFLGESEFLNISQEITITTDADNAEIYYTIDGSSPYQYQRIVGSESWQYLLSDHAVKYTAPVEIRTDTHFRVIAVPAGTETAIDPLLAKGSGTFLFNFAPTSYSWEEEQYAYRLASEDKKVKYFEENRQAFLRYHAEETAEEILYNTVIAASEQSSGTVQPESGDAEEGGHADDDI